MVRYFECDHDSRDYLADSWAGLGVRKALRLRWHRRRVKEFGNDLSLFCSDEAQGADRIRTSLAKP